MRTTLAILAAALFACGPTQDIGEERSAITGGTPTDGDPAVVLLRIGAARCTGVVVSPSRVLTAAHCVAGPKRAVAIVVGSDSEAPPAVVTDDVTIHPDFDEDTLAHDVAVIHAHVDVAPVPIGAIDGDWSGRTIRIVGYGRAFGGDDGTLVKRTGESAIDSVSSDEIALRAAPSRPCSGDSGGPAFASFDGEERVVALTSGGDPSCKGAARDVRLDANMAFLDRSSCMAAGGGGTPWIALVLLLFKLSRRR